MLVISLILGMLTADIVAGKGFALAGWSTPAASAHTGSFYGANENWVALAASEWPQQNNNWCGVANIEVAANYTFQLVGGANDTPFEAGGQQRIWNDLNSNMAISEWGYAPAGSKGSGIKANIASDGGTDPRSIAWGIVYESTAGIILRWQGPRPRIGQPFPNIPTFTFHNVIYHNSVSAAVAGLARTLERYGQPISVTIAHGLHSDIVSGVYANSDPITTYPNSGVNAVNAWDPAVGTPSGGYQSAREVTWDNYTFNTNANMWGTTYSSNNGYDPDPSVGIYVPNSQYPSHWIGYRTDIEPDGLRTVPVDFAVDENLNVMIHP